MKLRSGFSFDRKQQTYFFKFSSRPPPLTEPDGNAVRITPTVKMMGTASYNTVEDSIVAFPSEPVKGKAPQSGVAGFCLRLRIRKQPGLRRYSQSVRKVDRRNWFCPLRSTWRCKNGPAEMKKLTVAASFARHGHPHSLDPVRSKIKS